MRLLPTLALLLVLAAPAAAQDAVSETYLVPTVDDKQIYVKVRRPAGDAKAPIILTYSPYNVLSGGDQANDSLAARYVPEGYARAVADVLGTKNSSGCWDYGGLKEQQSGVDLVNFLAKQPWSNGKVAMIGGSYDGTTANMVAARSSDAPGLAAIVPIAAISRWYGYAFYAGVRYSGNSQNPTDEGFDTPLGFDFGFGREPADDPAAGPQPTIDRALPCDSVDHTAHGYSTAPDYDDFWLQRDYRKDAKRFTVPALIAHGWQDFNVKQDEGIGLFEALKERRAWTGLYLTQGTHGSPGGEPWDTLLDNFFLRFLKGGTPKDLPADGLVYTTPRDASGELEIQPEQDWPPPTTGDVEFPLGKEKRSYTDPGTVSEEAAAQNLDGEAGWLVYRSEPVLEDARIAGGAALDLTVATDRDHGHLVPTLFDEGPDGTLTPITRGFLNLAYRDGWSKGVPMPVGEPAHAVVEFLPQDWVLAKGHRLTVELASSNVAWAVPDQPGLTVTVDEARSRLLVPIVGAGSAPPVPGAGLPSERVPTLAAARRALKLGVTLRGRRLTVKLRAPRKVRVTLRILRGRKVVLRRSLLRASGRATVRKRLARPGRYRVLATVRTREGLLTRRKAIRLRR
jgi:X-Pro dipeptidyl-peptidase